MSTVILSVFRVLIIAILWIHTNGAYDADYDEYLSDDYYYEDEECTEDEFKCPDPYSWGCVSNSTKCNGVFDCTSGFDEDECPGKIPHQVFVCDAGENAVWARKDCPGNLECVRLCNGKAECSDGSDERSVGIGFKCTSAINKGDPSCLISEKYIERWRNLDDDFYSENSSSSNSICPDAQDICYSFNETTIDTNKCFQCIDGTVINIYQLCDGVVDCADLSDECLCNERSWAEKYPQRQKLLNNLCHVQYKKKCDLGFIGCSSNDSNKCIEPRQMCDGIRDCPQGEDEEACTPLSSTQSTDKSLAPEKQKLLCYDGVTLATYCDGRPECWPYFEDECQCQGTLPGFCKKSGFFAVEGCANLEHSQVCDGVYDCENGEDEDSCPHRRPCDSNDKSQNTYDVEIEGCNLVKNCPNGVDEENCPNETHFYCDDGSFISAEKVGDHFIDCPNAEDECIMDEKRLSKGQKMIGNMFLRVIMWVMSFTALAGNAVVIVQTARDLRYTLRRGATAAVSSRVGACNKILVFNLALADFLMGVYLLILNIKSLEFEGSYCTHDAAWRTSGQCEGLGVLVVLSSQTSVIIMVMMTSYRLFTVRCPFLAEKLHFRAMFVFVAVAWIPAAVVAFLPLISSEQVFAVAVSSKHLFGKYEMEKSEMLEFISKAEHLRAANATEPLLTGHSWYSIEAAICKMYPKICTNPEQNPIITQRFGYYSEDSVCMPRLYPRIGDGGWKLTSAIISFDFVSFIYILFAYFRIYRLTVIQEKGKNKHFWRSSSFSSVGEQRRAKEDKLIWHRITRLLVTDFICWTPICVIAFAALAGANIPPILYQVTAIVLLPINSALNPLLYSNAIPLVCYSLAARLCPGEWADRRTRSSFRKSRKRKQRFPRNNNNYKNKINSAAANLAASCTESNGGSNHVDRVLLNKIASINEIKTVTRFSPECVEKKQADDNRKEGRALATSRLNYRNSKKLSMSTDGLPFDNVNSTASIIHGRTSTSTCNSEVSSNSNRRHSFSLKPMRRIWARCFDNRSKSLRDTRISDPFVDELPLFRRPKSQSSVSTATQCTALPTDTDTIY